MGLTDRLPKPLIRGLHTGREIFCELTNAERFGAGFALTDYSFSGLIVVENGIKEDIDYELPGGGVNPSRKKALRNVGLEDPKADELFLAQALDELEEEALIDRNKVDRSDAVTLRTLTDTGRLAISKYDEGAGRDHFRIFMGAATSPTELIGSTGKSSSNEVEAISFLPLEEITQMDKVHHALGVAAQKLIAIRETV